MKRKIRIVFVVVVLALVFIIAGVPSLRYLKEHKPENLFRQAVSEDDIKEHNIGRKVTIDISVEEMCYNPLTEEVSPDCLDPEACNDICRLEGCKLFGLNHLSSEFKSGRCYCICYEESVLGTFE